MDGQQYSNCAVTDAPSPLDLTPDTLQLITIAPPQLNFAKKAKSERKFIKEGKRWNAYAFQVFLTLKIFFMTSIGWKGLVWEAILNINDNQRGYRGIFGLCKGQFNVHCNTCCHNCL